MMGWHGLSGALSVTSYHTHGHACGESVPPSTGGACGRRNYAFDRHCLKTFAGQLGSSVVAQNDELSPNTRNDSAGSADVGTVLFSKVLKHHLFLTRHPQHVQGK